MPPTMEPSDGDGDGDALRALCSLLEEDPAADAGVASDRRSSKKHSGPRKRRPKKKANAERLGSPPERCVATDEPAAATPTPRLAAEDDAARLKALRASAAPFVPVSPPLPPLASPTTLSLPVPMDALSLSPLSSPPLVPALSPPYFYRSMASRPSPVVIGGDFEHHERAFWTQYVIDAAEKERARRLSVLQQLQREEEQEIQRRRAWAIAAIEQEQQQMMREMFLDNMKNTQWFQSTITRLDHDYEVVCPNSWFGCTFSCMLKDLEAHVEHCVYRQVPDTLDQVGDESVAMDLDSYDVVCPNAMLGCSAIFPREELAKHLASCPVSAMTREQEWQERQEWQQNVIEMTEEERQRRMDEHRGQHDRFSFSHLQRLYEEQTAMMHVVLHEEIVRFTNQCQAEAERIRPAIELAIARLGRVVEELWGPDARVESYGSFATQLHGGHSDVDLVVFGATSDSGETGCNSMSQRCVSQLAAHLSAIPGGMYSVISAITRASIPLVKVVVTVEMDPVNCECGTVKIPIDITFDDPNDPVHNGVASASLLHTLIDEFYGLRELTLVLKHFLATRGLNDPYVGGLSSYGLVLMIIYVLREQGALVKSAPSGDMSQHEATLSSSDQPLSRFEAQKQKGTAVAREIVRQARVRQSVLIASAVNNPTELKRRSGAAAWEYLVGPLCQDGQQPGTRTSPHKSRSSEPFLLGKLLMDFLQWYGTDFRQTFDQITLLAPEPSNIGAFNEPKQVMTSPALVGTSVRSPHHQPVGGIDSTLMIQDPLQRDNNVGKTCYRISQVLRDFSDFLSVLTALIVRGSVMVPGIPSIPGMDESGESSDGKRSRSSSSHRILSSVFQMKHVAAASVRSTVSPSTG